MMTSLKTWCLLPLVVLLLLLSVAPTVTEVVQSMAQCEGFLLQETPPQIPDILENGNIQDQNRYKIICQTYVNENPEKRNLEEKKRFLTLYDTTNKIPVFSAYKFRGGETGGARPNWMIEPQLENLNNGQNMEDCNIHVEYTNQASDNDYTEDTRHNVNKGHLRPFSYGFNQNDKDSTCTLTNSVPQVESFIQGSWDKMESCVKCILEEYCKDNNNVIEGYLVTGALPGDRKLNNRVNIPSVLWSAFCCYSSNLKRWIASAYWGDNVPNQPDYLPTKTLQQLQNDLNIRAFPNTHCPLSTTVAEFYPQMNRNPECRCPLAELQK